MRRDGEVVVAIKSSILVIIVLMKNGNHIKKVKNSLDVLYLKRLAIKMDFTINSTFY